MSEEGEVQVAGESAGAVNSSEDGKTANLIYILYLVSLVVGITSIVGVIMAYVNRVEAPQWVQSHYQFQIRTFWIGLLYSVVGAALIGVFVGIPILLFTVVWFIVRTVKGMGYVGKGQAVPDPTTWMFG
jgi:uncharacterized membrane protein